MIGQELLPLWIGIPLMAVVCLSVWYAGSWYLNREPPEPKASPIMMVRVRPCSAFYTKSTGVSRCRGSAHDVGPVFEVVRE